MLPASSKRWTEVFLETQTVIVRQLKIDLSLLENSRGSAGWRQEPPNKLMLTDRKKWKKCNSIS